MDTLRIYCCVFFLFWANLIVAQNPQPFFRNYNTDHGLPSSETYHIIQDSKGYMWIATDNGVSRFDGYTFRNFSAKDGLTENVIFHLQEGVDGRIWMHGMSGELFYFENDSIYSYEFNHLIKEHTDNFISDYFYVDKDNSTYHIANNKGILQINAAGEMHIFSPKSMAALYIKKIEAYSFFQTINHLSNSNNHILPIEIHDDKEVIVENAFWEEYSTSEHRGLQMVGENQYLFYVKDSLYLVKDDKKEWSVPYPHRLTQYSIFFKNDGKIFIGSIDGHGVRMYDSLEDVSKGIFKQYLNGNAISNIYVDQKGGHWLATLNNGIYYAPKIDFLIYDNRFGIPDVYITALTIKNKNEIIFGSRSGDVFWLNVSEHKITRLPSQQNDTEIWHLLYDSNENVLWKGNRMLNYISLNDSNLINNKWQPVSEIRHETGFHFAIGHKRFNFSQDKKELLACNEFGFARVDVVSKEILYFSRKESKFPMTRTLTHFEDMERRTWVGNVNGLFEYKDDKLYAVKLHHPAFKLRVEDIGQLKDSTLVVGTKGSGVVFWKGDEKLVLDESMGLTSNMVENIHIDDNDQVWIGTLLGLNKVKVLKSEMDSTYFSIEHITSAHGLPSSEIICVRTIDNQVWVATAKGLVNFSNKTLNRLSPAPMIEQIQVNNESVEEEKNIQLSHRQNNLIFKFLSINYAQTGKVPYRYRLKPVNEDWIFTLDRSLTLPALEPNHYQFEVQAQNEDGFWSESTVFYFQIALPIWQRWWFQLCALVLLLTGIYLYYQNRLKKIKKENELEQKLFELERSALRAQMNPHFIFNVLNSIQFFILNDDKKEAAIFLSKFAKLVRTTLNNSRSAKIFLNDEIDTLRNYLSLEQMRFENQFEFQIRIDDDVRISEMEIPPMLIQPYLENAIAHGLTDQTKKGMVKIFFGKEKKYLKVSIIDNGIGIEQSKALKSQMENLHKSVGMSITQKRLEMIDDLKREKNVRIKELKSENEVLGTQIDIWIKVEE